MNILIVEDESAAVRRLEKLLAEAAPEATLLAPLHSVEAAVQWLSEHPQPDLILLDIHLADGASFEIFEHIEVTAPVIFTTAYDEYALQAFKVNAIDYLLKPIKPHELAASIEKYRRIFGNTQAVQPAVSDYTALLDMLRRQEPSPSYLRRMLIRFGATFKLVDMSDVAYFYTKDKITFVVTYSTAKRYPADYPLDRLETLLDPALFFRINRQVILHVQAIREMHPYSKSRVKIDLYPPADIETVVSAERSSDFKKWLVGE